MKNQPLIYTFLYRKAENIRENCFGGQLRLQGRILGEGAGGCTPPPQKKKRARDECTFS